MKARAAAASGRASGTVSKRVLGKGSPKQQKPAKPTWKQEEADTAFVNETVPRLRELGVPDTTMYWIKRELPGIVRCLRKSLAQADVSDVVKEALKASKALVEIADKAAHSEIHAAAITRIDTAAVLSAWPQDGTKPEVLEFRSMARLIHATVQAAASETHGQARGYRDLAGAVMRVEAAIRRPIDEAALAFARRAYVKADETSVRFSGDLKAVLSAVFFAGTGEREWDAADGLKGAQLAVARRREQYQQALRGLSEKGPLGADVARNSGSPEC